MKNFPEKTYHHFVSWNNKYSGKLDELKADNKQS